MPQLTFKTGPLAGSRVAVDAPMVLGRELVDLVIEDPEVSRRHVSVRPVEDALEIEDLGSLNGTWVNGTRIRAVTRLQAGDEIRLGDTLLQVEAEATRAAGTVIGANPASAPPQQVVLEPSPADPGADDPRGAPRAEPAPTPASAVPFGAFQPPSSGSGRQAVASRRLTPTLVSFSIVIATAIALLVYFAGR